MAIDLCKDPTQEVVSVDINQKVLEDLAGKHPVQIRVEDLSSATGIKNAIKDADIVIGSVPYSIGFSMLETVIRAGKDIVDMSYFSDDPFSLDKLAKANGVSAVVDCGVAPGMANIILGNHMRTMKVSNYECYVGGVPKSRLTPLAYKSPFPVHEVLEEYAAYGTSVENGKVFSKAMLSEPMMIEMDKVGTMAGLNSEGLRTLLQTTDIPNMLEKTLRYPEHVEHMRTFMELGFFQTDPLKVGKNIVEPIEVMATLLEPHWKYEEGEADLTVMKLVISGNENGEEVSYTYELYDEYDPVNDTPSMARTTGYTCNAVCRLILDGLYSQKGISPPEYIGLVDGSWENVDRYLKDRNVNCNLI